MPKVSSQIVWSALIILIILIQATSIAAAKGKIICHLSLTHLVYWTSGSTTATSTSTHVDAMYNYLLQWCKKYHIKTRGKIKFRLFTKDGELGLI